MGVLKMSFPINSNHAMTAKAVKLLEENNFLRKSFKNFGEQKMQFF